MIKIDADAMTRARQIATSELKQKLRDEGCRATDERMYGLGCAIKRYLAEHPEIVERAAMEVAQWRKKGLLRRTRRTVDFIELLRSG
jgi:hypothetical protein